MPNPIYVIGHVNPDADSIVVRRRQRGAGCGRSQRGRESDHAREGVAGDKNEIKEKAGYPQCRDFDKQVK